MTHTKFIYTRNELNYHIKYWYGQGYYISDVAENIIVMTKGDKHWNCVVHFNCLS